MQGWDITNWERPHSSSFKKVLYQTSEKYTCSNYNFYPQNKRGLIDAMKLSWNLKVKNKQTHLIVYRPVYVPTSSPESDAPYCSNRPCDIWSMFWGLNSHKPCINEHQTWAPGIRTPLPLREGPRKVVHMGKSHFSWGADF